MSSRSNCFITLFKSTIFLLIFFLVHYESLQIKEVTFLSVICVLSSSLFLSLSRFLPFGFLNIYTAFRQVL